MDDVYHRSLFLDSARNNIVVKSAGIYSPKNPIGNAQLSQGAGCIRDAYVSQGKGWEDIYGDGEGSVKHAGVKCNVDTRSEYPVDLAPSGITDPFCTYFEREAIQHTDLPTFIIHNNTPIACVAYQNLRFAQWPCQVGS